MSVLSKRELTHVAICSCGHTRLNHSDEPPYNCCVFMNETLGKCTCKSFEYPNTHKEVSSELKIS